MSTATATAAAPANANEECVGPMSDKAGTASSCEGCPNQSACKSGEARKAPTVDPAIAASQARIAHRIFVLSGKGGVGKSTFSAQLAFGLARQGFRVGLLDVDICGPSIPLMMGLRGSEVHQSATGWSPVYVDVDAENPNDECELGVMSIGFLMPDPDAAVIWRGPRKTSLMTQFFGNVDWGELDYLVTDFPPGTSDEHITMMQLLKPILVPGDGAVVVTTPQEVAMTDVRKELNFCRQTGLDVLGVVENMAPMSVPLSGLRFTCNDEDCTEATLAKLRKLCPEVLDHVAASVDVFPRHGGGPEAMAKQFNVPFLGRVPLDRALQRACDEGSPGLLSGSAAKAPLRRICDAVVRASGGTAGTRKPPVNGAGGVVHGVVANGVVAHGVVASKAG